MNVSDDVVWITPNDSRLTKNPSVAASKNAMGLPSTISSAPLSRMRPNSMGTMKMSIQMKPAGVK